MTNIPILVTKLQLLATYYNELNSLPNPEAERLREAVEAALWHCQLQVAGGNQSPLRKRKVKQ